MIAAYLRVSTDDQTNASQRAAIERWIAAGGYDPAAVRWYEDTASGATASRPAFDRLQADIFEGTIRSVVVYKLDRLSRNIRDGVNLLCDWIDRRVRLVSVTQQLDFSGPAGKMVAVVLLSLADIEREYIRERQGAGIAEAKKRGVYSGKPAGSIHRRRKGMPDAVRAVADAIKDGGNVSQVARRLGLARDTVYRYREIAREEGLLS